MVHECAGPDISSVDDLAALVARARADPRSPRVVPYWGQAVAARAEARDLLAATGAHGLAGDLFVDGSLGSRTAALRLPYADAPGCHGHPYLDAGAVGAHVAACTEAGVQAGFHVIGDAAADTVVDGLRRAARRTSSAAVRARAHRVEHLEMVDAAQMATLAELGVVASVQPVFDAWWGGPSGMYVDRLGADRARGDEPVRRAARRRGAAGLRLRRPGDAARAVGGRPGRGGAPHGGVGRAAGGRARRAHGRWAPGGGGALAARGSPRARRARFVRACGSSGDVPRCLRTVQDGRVLHDTL